MKQSRGRATDEKGKKTCATPFTNIGNKNNCLAAKTQNTSLLIEEKRELLALDRGEIIFPFSIDRDHPSSVAPLPSPVHNIIFLRRSSYDASLR